MTMSETKKDLPPGSVWKTTPGPSALWVVRQLSV